MDKEQCIKKIKKLLLMQQCNGATKQEEITSFKKALNLTLVYDIIDVDLDEILRHIYNLEHNIDYTEPFGESFENINLKPDPIIEEYDFEDNNFEFQPRRKDNIVKNIALGIIIGGFLTWTLKGLTKYIQGLLPFIILIVIPFVVVLISQNIKMFFRIF